MVRVAPGFERPLWNDAIRVTLSRVNLKCYSNGSVPAGKEVDVVGGMECDTDPNIFEGLAG
jgi:hypothetical protein